METNEVRNELLKTSPVVATNTITYFGAPLSDWMYGVSIIYVIMQITWLGVKMWNHFQRRKEGG